MRQTRIIATLGPASTEPGIIAALIAAGVDLFRLNFSHGTHDSHGRTIELVRTEAARVRRQVAILQDLSGPKIRTGRLRGGQPIALNTGNALRIVTGDDEGEAGCITTPYAELARAVRPGDRLLLDDGRIELEVQSSDGREIVTRVVNGGLLGEHKGINAPDVPLPSGLTEKDADDLRFGLSQGVDYVALSFVQSPDDVGSARALIARMAAGPVPLIAKIERPQAVARIASILDVSDGVMVARGDLGLELPLEQVPRVQKEITREARERGLPVIIATEVLDSMRTEPRPTRAEVSDAAHAVDSGVDAIMLAGETAVGRWPVRAVQTLDAIIREAETMRPWMVPVGPVVVEVEHNRALCEAAVSLASSAGAQAIVAVTRGGKTARVLSAFRPDIPIFAATPRADTARRVVLHRGVYAVAVPFPDDTDSTAEAIERELIDCGLLQRGAVIVFVSIAKELHKRDANYVQVQRVG